MGHFVKEFDYIKIKLASPSRILEWANRKLPNGQSVGEIRKSETINYRTFKPEMDGLFCERIFGPIKDFECACGKYIRVQSTDLICDRCGVELTTARVRRHRLAHIKLVYPVVHVWYLNSKPNFLALLLEVESCEKTFNTAYTIHSETCKKCGDLKPTTSAVVKLWDERIMRIKLASIAYFISEDEISFYGLHWDLQQYRYYRLIGSTDYPLKPYPKPKVTRYSTPKYLQEVTPNFIVGAELIKRELERLDLKSEIYRTRIFVFNCSETIDKKYPYYNFSKWFRKWEQERLYKLRDQAIKRIRILENLLGTGASPAWMILEVLPVIPPALRPMIQLEGGRFASSDLNELYRRIITRNTRLLRLLQVDAPELIIRNEKRMLQEAIDSLIDNGRRGKIALGANNRPLKSLSDIIKGKYGRFRQNLLGKRVDYSGRSVIVVGPTLKLNQCGLPYEMALELFQPFIVRELLNRNLASNIKAGIRLIQKNEVDIDIILKKILTNHPIFLNRAPTLHRLGIQAFEPILIRGRAIKLHPLVCSAFNADFDGDQMAIHVPLSLEAQAECYMLMFAPYNFLSPANGDPVVLPSQDMVLGCYYLTVTNISNLLGSGHYFSDFEDVILAYNQNLLEIHSSIWVRYLSNSTDKKNIFKIQKLNDNSIVEYSENLQVRKTLEGKKIVQYIKTTTGRVIFNYTIQKALDFFR